MTDDKKTAAVECRGHRSNCAPKPAGWISVLCTLLAIAGPAARQVLAQTARSRNVVYVESNDPAGNAIFAFARNDADGSLTPLESSPFPAGGTGISFTTALGPFDSDQNVIVNPEHTLLYAVNGGSDTIAVFTIHNDGSLTPILGSPFPSGGANPVSVGLAGNIFCVVNKDEDPDHQGQSLPNYTSFHLTNEGQLIPYGSSTVFDDIGSDPSQALFSPDGRLLFGADFLGGLLRTFKVSANGRLIPRDAQQLPASQFAGTGSPPLPLGLAVHPMQPILYVDFVTINRVGIYRYSKGGELTFIRSAPDSGKGPCWALVNKAATRLYASNTGDSSISVFDISGDPTEPIEIQHLQLRTTGNCFQFALDSTEKFLHVVTQGTSLTSPRTANGLSVLSVAADGRLTEVPSSPTILPVPALVRPQGVAAL
jgi:6-phosphogluconolactonase (cycloisomerase 2 family)